MTAQGTPPRALTAAAALAELGPKLQSLQAEVQALRWVAAHLLDEHARLAAPHTCLCPLCNAAREWVQPHQAIPALLTRIGQTLGVKIKNSD